MSILIVVYKEKSKRGISELTHFGLDRKGKTKQVSTTDKPTIYLDIEASQEKETEQVR